MALDLSDPDTVLLGLSVRSAWQRFHGCDPDYIRTTCHGRCCDAPGRPGGTMVTIHRSEQAAIEARGGVVRDSLLVTDGVCTFKTPDHLCALHFTPDKPFGCIASPFTVSGRTLVVRNRYRLLRCYAGQAQRRDIDTLGWPPAFMAFRSSLALLLGEDQTREVEEALWVSGDAHDPAYRGPTRVPVTVHRLTYEKLVENDQAKKQ